MLTVKECLETVKADKYIVLSYDDTKIGEITLENIGEPQKSLMFSPFELLDYLGKWVCEIIPCGIECGCNISIVVCKLRLAIELPFD